MILYTDCLVSVSRVIAGVACFFHCPYFVRVPVPNTPKTAFHQYQSKKHTPNLSLYKINGFASFDPGTGWG